jgi:hypothetical protein
MSRAIGDSGRDRRAGDGRRRRAGDGCRAQAKKRPPAMETFHGEQECTVPANP